MDFKNKYLVITLRTIFGLFMLFSGVSGFLAGKSMQGVPEPMIPIMQVLWNTGLFQMIKSTEVVAGLMLAFGFLPALAMLFIAPITVGVLVFNSMLSPEYLPMGIVLLLFTSYFGYVYWDKYKALFTK